MNKYFLPLGVFVFVLVISLSGFILIGMKDGIPLDFSRIRMADQITIKNQVVLNNNFSKDVSGVFEKFSSEEEFKDYIAESELIQGFYYAARGIDVVLEGSVTMTSDSGAVLKNTGSESAGIGGGASADRVSGTNVQVIGIDEPDIVKTDGKNIYLSRLSYFRPFIEPRAFINSDVIDKAILSPDRDINNGVKIINAFPPADLKEVASVKEVGNMLLSGDDLVVFSGSIIVSYDISTPSSPFKTWEIELDQNTQFVDARMLNGRMYMITKRGLNRSRPCPIEPFSVNEKAVVISCDDIYRPASVMPVDSTYNVSMIDIRTGDVTYSMSFLGSYNSTIYMSKNNVYVAYSYSGDMMKFIYGFVVENRNVFSESFVRRVETLMNYDISQNSKMSEFQMALNELKRSLDEDDILKFENEMQNKMSGYLEIHKRDLQKTDIVKIDADDLDVLAVGTVSGNLLNQFSIDEYDGHLRLATTIGQGFFGVGFGSFGESENDVYVLDKDMKVAGSIKGLGLDERIYSARFIEDKGYIVTFKQIDPFFVIDLSNPKDPKVSGELKIPGYSSYLHPIDKDRIVGVGKEGSQVKISLFDVSDPKYPKEASKYTLDEYWTDVLNTHHAFLMDKDHKVFFIPGGKGGYVFSYENDELSLKKAIGNVNAQRALYLNDYMYIIGSDRIVVVDEDNWERVNELRL